jgi:cobalt/nickel transport protein
VKKAIILAAMMLNFQILASPCLAHFGMIIPSDSMVMQGESKTVKLALSFSHPFEGLGMEMVKPKKFAVRANGKKQDLLAGLTETRVMGHTAWAAPYKIKRPGVYMFYMEPQPYWEAAEDIFIVHYTKTVVTAFGDDEGWDEEILNGKPVPFAEVEVEYYNKGAKIKAPTAVMIAQTIKADQNGVFTYAAPAAGWWGFAALNPADYKLSHNGEPKDVELGAIIWVEFHDWK